MANVGDVVLVTVDDPHTHVLRIIPAHVLADQGGGQLTILIMAPDQLGLDPRDLFKKNVQQAGVGTAGTAAAINRWTPTNILAGPPTQ